MGRFLGFVHILPVVGGAQLGMLDIAELGPHGIQGNIIRWTPGVVRRSLHTTETQPVEAAQLPGMVFPSGEKLLINSPSRDILSLAPIPRNKTPWRGRSPDRQRAAETPGSRRSWANP